MENRKAQNCAREDVYIRQVQNDGKVQIPKGIRELYQLNARDTVIWVVKEKEVIITFSSTTLQPKERKG